MSDRGDHVEPKWQPPNRDSRGAAGAIGPAARQSGLAERLGDIAASLRELAGLASLQRSLMEADDPQPLLDLLASRQEVVDQLADPAQGLGAVAGEIAAAKSRAGRGSAGSDAASDRVVGLIAEIEASLARVIETDLADQARLESRLREIGGQLATNRTAYSATAAYAGRTGPRRGGEPGPRFTDQKG